MTFRAPSANLKPRRTSAALPLERQHMALHIQTGVAASPLRVILQGQEGVGKTTWAASCPGALFLTCEDGGGILDYARVLCSSWDDLRQAVWTIQREGLPNGLTAIVIDTIDSFERLLWQELIEKANCDTIEEVGGGFGKGYTRAAENMAALSADLDIVRRKHGINVILLAHVHVRPFNDPNGPAYDRYEMRMHKGTAALWSSWADAVLFACFDVTVLKTGKKGRVQNASEMEKGKATDIRRVVYTSKDAAYDAKNRHGLPDELPLDFAAFAKAIKWGAKQAPKPLPVEHAAEGEGHHASFDEAERKWFMAELGTASISYPNLKAFCASLNRQKPSALDSAGRRKLLDYLHTPAGQEKFAGFLTNGASAK
ncbi:hypothetical protein LBMAG42_57180 [Deltaproteobacteria bacterium]|nr:hypothetical protein LBMAG42_57180 [Deltaproteobacteria bacterium]